MQKKVAAEKNGRTYEEDADTESGKGAETEGTEPAGAEDTGDDNAGDVGDQTGDSIAQDQDTLTAEEEAEAESITEEEIIDYLLAKHPDVKGIYATNGDAVKLAVNALERNKTDAAIVGYDADEEELDALADGKVDALVLQNPFGMGYATIIAAARAALSMGNEAVVDTGYTWLTKENIEDKAIQALLYH